MTIPIDYIEVELSYRKPTKFDKKGYKFKQGNTDFELSFKTAKEDTFTIGDTFTIFFVNDSKNIAHLLTSDYYTYSNGIITIPAINNFVAEAGNYSFIIETDKQYSYKASYKVETGDTELILEDLPEFNGEFISSIEEENGVYYAYNQDGELTASWTTGGEQKDVVKSINNVPPDENGDVTINPKSIPVLINGIDTGVNLSDVLDFINTNMVQSDQLKFQSLTDVQYPTDHTKAYSLYLDEDMTVKALPFSKKGTSVTQEARIIGSKNQSVKAESGFFEVEFDKDTEQSSGDAFTKYGNGIMINNISHNFKAYAVITASFQGMYLQFPATLTYRIMKNGKPTSMIKTEVVNFGDVITTRLDITNDAEDETIKVGDIFTIETKFEDGSGYVGDGSWASYTLQSGRTFAVYYRSITNGGNFWDVENLYGKYLTAVKTDGDQIEKANSKVLHFAPNVEHNDDNLNYVSDDSSFIFITESLTAWDIYLSQSIAKTGDNNATSNLQTTLIAEQWNEELEVWEVYKEQVNSQMKTIVTNGYYTHNFNWHIQFDTAGKYRVRVSSQDLGNGTIFNHSDFSTLTLDTGEVLNNSLATKIAIYETAIN